MDFKPYLRDGVKEMKVPSLNPYVLPTATIRTNWMNTTLTNLNLYNSHDYVVDYFDIDLDQGVIRLNLTTDHMEMNSQYEIDGRILQFILHGEGKMEGNVSKFSFLILFSR